MRGIFFDEESARAVAAQLLRSGWEARVEIERLAGEDDDEDHQWAVLTDAPAIQFELLIDAHDGWLDDEAPWSQERGRGLAEQGRGLAEQDSTPTPAPLDLPLAPRRIKRPPRTGAE